MIARAGEKGGAETVASAIPAGDPIVAKISVIFLCAPLVPPFAKGKLEILIERSLGQCIQSKGKYLRFTSNSLTLKRM